MGQNFQKRQLRHNLVSWQCTVRGRNSVACSKRRWVEWSGGIHNCNKGWYSRFQRVYELSYSLCNKTGVYSAVARRPRWIEFGIQTKRERLLQTDRHLFLQRLYSRHSGHIGGSQPWTDAAGTHYTEVIQLRLYSAYRRLCDSRQHCATLSRDPAQTHWIVIRGRSRLWPQEMPVCNQSEFQLVYTVSKKRLNFETL